MGLFRVSIEVGHPTDRAFQEVEAVVVTGAFCSMFPASFFDQLGIASDTEREFTLADGRKQRYPMGEARFRWEGLERTSSVIFGPEGVSPGRAHTAEPEPHCRHYPPSPYPYA